MTAAVFARSFLALKVQLPSILVQVAKSANTNGLSDTDNDRRHYKHMVKYRIKEVMSEATDFTQERIQTLVPTESKLVVNAMRFVGYSRTACDRLFAHVKKLDARIFTPVTPQKPVMESSGIKVKSGNCCYDVGVNHGRSFATLETCMTYP
ncbi:hypothetical protein PHET_11944 [Paragonimus heterotremus]|uniref:Uncharacterized protein n=1 Tax=Paragonimus heterotremus TaxID=100268 RepID=A0A8J4T0K4_9TREM|nr:hypothetical protein PHET_11944 [Paragonimus heterotremus]